MNNNNYQDETLTKKEKDDAAGKDIAEMTAKGVGQAYSGKVGSKAIEMASNTRGGQRTLEGAGKRLSNSSPVTRNLLANNQQNIHQVKPFVNSLIGGGIEEDLSSSTDDNIDNGVEESNDSSSTTEGSGILSGVFKKLPFKYKMIIIGVIAGLVFLVIFLIIFISPLMYLDIIPIGNSGGNSISSSSGYSSVSNATTYYMPIGSSEVTSQNGISYADGNPVSTNIIYNSDSMDIYPIDSSDVNVIAAKDGIVIYPTSDDSTDCSSTLTNDSCGEGYGNYVKIDHGDGNVTLYAHLEIINVSSGDKVKQGQVIGKMGSSGNTDEVKLHFEILFNGEKYNPNNYVNKDNPRPEKYTGALSHVDGKNNKQTVCLTLKNSGFPSDSVAALMTNINAESGFRTVALGDNGTSYGLCQWHNGRWDNLKNTFPSSYQTVSGQLEFLMYELKNYDNLYNSLVKGSKGSSDLAYDFCYKFERPYDKANTCRKRANGSSTFVNYVNNGCN